MSDITMSNSWLIGYTFFMYFYTFCYQFVALKNLYHTMILFPLTGDWTVNEIRGDDYCRSLIVPLL
jgi:hypothetical protein